MEKDLSRAPKTALALPSDKGRGLTGKERSREQIDYGAVRKPAALRHAAL